jgi:hypothetical protein
LIFRDTETIAFRQQTSEKNLEGQMASFIGLYSGSRFRSFRFKVVKSKKLTEFANFVRHVRPSSTASGFINIIANDQDEK